MIVHDLIATGGTARAVAEMVESMEATVVGLAYVVELSFLRGRDKLTKYDLHTILKY